MLSFLFLSGCGLVNTPFTTDDFDYDYAVNGGNKICYDNYLLSCRDVDSNLEQLPRLPLDWNPEIASKIRYYLTKDPDHIKVAQVNMQPHLREMVDIFRHYNLPTDLLNVIVIESKGILHAKSHFGARGPWQFMKPTAKSLGLKINLWKDERTDVNLSTIAAAKYLRKLYLRLGDWDWALASYNAGPTKVSRIQRASSSKDFWQNQHRLPKETQDFVAKIIAVTIIKENNLVLRRHTASEMQRIQDMLRRKYAR